MPVPIVFRRGGEGAVATYDYFDLASATGYKLFYLCATTTSSGTTYFLSPTSAITSCPFKSIGNGTSGGDIWKNVLNNVDFDYEFNKPMNVKGDIIVNFTHEHGSTAECRTTVTVYHYDGTTETQLGTALSEELKGGANEAKRVCFKFNVATIQRFKKGDKLRITILFEDNDMGGTGEGSLWHDPSGTNNSSYNDLLTGAVVPTPFTISVPFRIDL